MTAFEITLVCLILYIIDWIYILKNWDNKNHSIKSVGRSKCLYVIINEIIQQIKHTNKISNPVIYYQSL